MLLDGSVSHIRDLIYQDDGEAVLSYYRQMNKEQETPERNMLLNYLTKGIPEDILLKSQELSEVTYADLKMLSASDNHTSRLALQAIRSSWPTAKHVYLDRDGLRMYYIFRPVLEGLCLDFRISGNYLRIRAKHTLGDCIELYMHLRYFPEEDKMYLENERHICSVLNTVYLAVLRDASEFLGNKKFFSRYEDLLVRGSGQFDVLPD